MPQKEDGPVSYHYARKGDGDHYVNVSESLVGKHTCSKENHIFRKRKTKSTEEENEEYKQVRERPREILDHPEQRIE
mgnify:CR=1 FL=1